MKIETKREKKWVELRMKNEEDAGKLREKSLVVEEGDIGEGEERKGF